MKKMYSMIKKLFKKQQIRFLFVGGLNTIVGYGSYTILLLLGINYLIANTVSTIVGVIHSYMWNRKFTFESNKKIGKELIKFVLVYVISYLIGMLNISILVSKVGINEYMAGAFNLVITTLISWFGHKYFSFKEVKK